MSFVNAEAGPSRAHKRPRLAHDASTSRTGVTPPRTRARKIVLAVQNDVFNASAPAPAIPAQPNNVQQQRVAEWVQQRHPHAVQPVYSPKPSPAKSATAVSALQADQAYAHLRTPQRCRERERERVRDGRTSERGEGEGSVLFSDRTPRSKSGTPQSRGDEMIEALLAAYGPKPELVRPPGYGWQPEWEDDARFAPGGGDDIFVPRAEAAGVIMATMADGEPDTEEDGSFLPVDPFWQGEPAAPTEPLPHHSTEDLDTPLPIPTEALAATATAVVDESSQLRADLGQMQTRASDYLPRAYAPALPTQPSQEPLTGEGESDTLVFQPTEVSATYMRDKTRSPTPPPLISLPMIERLARAAEDGASYRGEDATREHSHLATYAEEANIIDGEGSLAELEEGRYRYAVGLSSEPSTDDEEVIAGPSRSAASNRRRSLSRSRRGPLVVQDDDDDDDDRPLAQQYHSGDSDLYEMDHRPILERTEVKRDIREFVASLRTLRKEQQYKVVDRLGEGTFSSVYLAKDVYHNRYSNRYWSGKASIRRPDLIHKKRYDKPVALKKVLATSSPARIENELAILEALRGCRNVSALITAFREDDQVIIVLPYHQSDDFRHFYRLMDAEHVRSYMRNLMESLADIHARGIIHRDVKPANFLYDYAAQTGVLVDFGLAERYVPPRKIHCQHQGAGLEHLHGKRVKTHDTVVVEQAAYDARKKSKGGSERVGIPKDDKRPPMRANRAGTRGFRAPEVLLKCPDQTFAIDVWSAGIMMLSILTHKFPIFNSNDDTEALMEIAAIYGRLPMEKCAMLHTSNVPTLDNAPIDISTVILKLNPHLYTPPYANPTRDQAKAHIESMDDAMKLCQELLRLDCTKRITAKRALRHPFLADPTGAGTDVGMEEGAVHPMYGKCGSLHHVEGNPEEGFGEGHAKHKASFGTEVVDMPLGMGIPSARDELCPEHLHFQQRRLENPLLVSRPLWSPAAAEEESEESEDGAHVDLQQEGQSDGEDGEEGDEMDMEGEETLVEHGQYHTTKPVALEALPPGVGRLSHAAAHTADETLVYEPTYTTAGDRTKGKAQWTGYDGAPERALKDVSINASRPDRMVSKVRAMA